MSSELNYSTDVHASQLNHRSEWRSDIKQSKPEDSSNNSIAKQVQAFAEKTSCHGVQKIAEHKAAQNNCYRWKNVIWLCLTLFSFGMACHSLINILLDYSNYPTSTLMKREYVEKLEFPAVTFCNLNVAVFEKALLHEEFRKFRRILDPQSADWKKLSNPHKKHRIISAFNTLSQEEKKLVGHKIEDMLLDCQFEKLPCGVDDFFLFFNLRFGLCYSFNYGFHPRTVNGLENKEIRLSHKTGKEQGLVLILDIQSDLYMPMSDDVGVQLLLHKSRHYPDMEEQGIALAPGFMTSLGLSMMETIEAEPPYGRCVTTDSKEDRERNMYSFLGLGYARKTCMKSCLQVHIIRRCRCCDPNTVCNPSGLDNMFGLALPNPTNLTNCNSSRELRCLSSVEFEMKNDIICERECPPRCKQITYDVEHSSAVWPNKMLASSYYRDINGSVRLENASADDQLSFVRNNLLKIDVHFKSRSKTVTVTQPTYTWIVLLSNIGGQLGLWLGFSLLTAFEFLELLLDIVTVQSLRILRRLS